MVHGGLCLAAGDDGAIMMVEGGIPGEDVEVAVRYRKGRTSFASVVDVVAPSPHRVTPPCPYVPDCGGCQWQHIDYAHQLALKREVVTDALDRQRVPVPDTVEICGMDEPWRYRRRGEFHVVPGPAGVQDAGLGFNRARSWRPIAIEDCLIHDRAIADALPALRNLARRGAPDLATLHVTAGDGGRELLVRAKPSRALAAEAIDAVAHDLGSLQLCTDSTSLTWRGHSYRVSPDTFMQVNWAQMEALYTRVLDALGVYAGLRVVDAYAGVGVLAVHVAGRAREVVCIENNRDAARLGVLNARVNDVAGGVRYVRASVEQALPAIAADGPVDRLILDPPRAGCGGRVTAWLALAGPARAVYVSCDPATLARDLHVLVASGPYAIEHLAIVDMFPQTHHVECVVSLARA
jgi:23S rRNA (uracil1939-C5)-methyltransferase